MYVCLVINIIIAKSKCYLKLFFWLSFGTKEPEDEQVYYTLLILSIYTKPLDLRVKQYGNGVI